MAVDGTHDFIITGTAKRADGSAVANTALKLSFDGNKGHINRAKFVVDNGSGGNDLVEETTATTDAQGKFSVHVLSSDDVSTDIKIKVKWTDENGKEHDVGEKACDFAASMSLRRFGLVNYPDEEDTGWIFDDTTLTPAADSTEIIAPSGTTPAKVYLKFQIDPSIPRDTNYFNSDGTPRRPLDDDGNWKFVNGHHLIIRIDSITPQEGETFDGTISDYATLLDANGQPTDAAQVVTSSDGAAQVLVKAGPMISQAKEVTLSVEDTTEHSS